MYINKIEELIDMLLDDFYNVIIINNKEFLKIINEINFIKYQIEINKILIDYEKSIDKKDIEEIVTRKENIKTIIEIIKKYLGYYVFLTIAFFYKGKIETFINNTIEFFKNQPSYNFKIDNFFNSESNSNIIKFNELIQRIIGLVDSEPNKLAILASKPMYVDAINFLNVFGQEFVLANFKLENLEGNKHLQAHNIIKVLILNELYIKTDKNEIYEILQEADKIDKTYIYIDIIIPKADYIDYSMIESVLEQDDVQSGLASEIYDFILKGADVDIDLSIDEKITSLINHKIVIPIVDDFLLYHKDTERYEKVTMDTKKKKEDTKIRYIISKIDAVTEYYSQSVQKSEAAKKELDKYFYMPLSDRNAILINNNEELKIIKKLLLQGKRTLEGNEYYNDLMSFRRYPYINFKEFNKYGFSFNCTETIDAVRYVNFEHEKHTDLDMRVGTSGYNINIIGFLIPSNAMPIQCISNDNIINIKSLKYKSKKQEQNGFNATLQLIKYELFKKKPFGKYGMWLFDLETDNIIMDNYVQLKKLTQEQQCKMIVAQLYDDIIKFENSFINAKLAKVKSIKFYNFKQLIKKISKEILPFPEQSIMFNKILQNVYYKKYTKTEKKYDSNEDIFYGVYDNVIKLPIISKKQLSLIETISSRDILEQKEIELEKTDVQKYGAICQHFISWDIMSAIRKKNPNKFSDLLFEFTNKFVIINNESDYICKSCGTQINLKIFVLDGAYDEDGRFITLSVPMEVPLEDVPEYQKYTPTIRNLDRLIDRIASVSRMHFFIGSSVNVKWRKRSVIKDTIDLLLVHNNNLKGIYKERNDKVSSLYGISKELTNLFIFELDNSIFVYSSKDKDHYKGLKKNNVTIYIILLMLLELSDSQLLFLGSDKSCNYYFFEKYGMSLFNDIKIRKNNKNDIVPIQNYPTLCYVLYFISCMISKYNMWYHESETEQKTKKINPVIQKIIINTTVDFINSILEFYTKKKTSRIYEIIAMKFFNRLNTSYQNNDILDKINKLDTKKIIIDNGKKRFITGLKPIEIAKVYTEGTYSGVYNYYKYVISKMFIKKRNIAYPKYYNINNITNCETGTFHNWVPVNTKLECSICKKTLDNLEYNQQETDNARNAYELNILKTIAKKYCQNGSLHNFIVDNKLKCNVCLKCKYVDQNKLSINDLQEINKNVDNIKNKKKEVSDKIMNIKIDEYKKKFTKTMDFVSQLKSEYGKSKYHKEDYYGYIKKFMLQMENIIGKDVNINGENIYLLYDTYIIDHDQNGYKLDKPLIITEKDAKLNYKKDHSFFKRDVVYYVNSKVGKIEVYYDAISLLLLGYKELNREYEYSKINNVYLKVNYSVYNKLKYMGYESKNINIEEKINELKIQLGNDEQTIVKHIVSDISRNRIKKLKKFITDVQRILYRIKYNYDDKIVEKNEKPTNLVDKYSSKLNKIILRDEQTKQKVFKKWDSIKTNLFFENISDKTINLNTKSKYFYVDDINSYDYNGNIILYYIIEQLTSLIEFNSNKFTKVTIIYLIIDIINHEHSLFNIDNRNTNFEIQRFNYLISSKTYIYDIEEIGHGIESETYGFYEEFKDPDEQVPEEEIEKIEDAKEEEGALDMDVEIDYEIDYTDGVNVNVEQNSNVDTEDYSPHYTYTNPSWNISSEDYI